MKNSKLIEVLKVFSSEEFQELELFLQSAFLSKSLPLQEKSIQLYQYLANFFPELSAKKIDKEVVYKELYLEQPYKKGRLEKVMSALLKQLELFIITKNKISTETSFENNLLLTNFYKSRNLDRLHSIALKNLEKRQAQISVKDREDLHRDYLVQQLITDYKSVFNKRDNDINLPNTIKSLDIYYLASRLELTCTLLAQTNFHNRFEINQHLEILEQLKPFFQNPEFCKVPLIKVYSLLYLIFDAQKSSSDSFLEHIKSLEEVLHQYRNNLRRSHLLTLHSFNRSFMIFNLNLGHKDLNRYAFEIYKDHLEKKLLGVDNGIHSANFKNIVSIAIKEKEYVWVHTFLKKYKDEIVGTDYPEQVYQFNLANYFFHIKEIDKAQELLGQEYEDLYYKLAAKRLEIKIYFEQKSDLLEYKLNAFKQFIHRLSKNKLPEIVRSNNNNFINILKQILAPINNSKSKMQRIKSKIEEMGAVKDKDWLIEIIDDSF